MDNIGRKSTDGPDTIKLDADERKEKANLSNEADREASRLSSSLPTVFSTIVPGVHQIGLESAIPITI